VTASTGFRRRLAVRLRRFGLSVEDQQIEMLEQYYGLLLRWNTRINLTGLPLDGFPTESMDRLLIEPIQAAELVQDTSLRWFDLGSGSGSPALPFKIVRPASDCTLVESVGKKAAFLREAVRVVGLSAVTVLTTRIEDLPTLVAPQSADLVTLRAVKIDQAVGASIARLLKPSGRLLLFGGVKDELPGFSWHAERPLTKPGDVVRVLGKR
jgi:16S rRNA (guanine527-N7)-methyltransferase